MAAIGSVTVTSFQGRILPAIRQAGRLETAPGELGPIAAIGGWVSPTSEVRTTEVMAGGTTLAQAQARREVYRALGGTVQTVTDQFGETWTDAFVQRAVPAYSLDSRGFYVVSCDFEIIAAPAAPV